MRKFNLVALGLFFAAVFSVSAFAQAQVPPARIGLINTDAFLDDKPGAGIPKLKTAFNSLNAEFKSVNDELTTLTTQYQQKVDEYNKLKNSAVPAGDLDAKASAIQDLETSIKRKQEDAKSRYDKRQDVVVGPVYQDIGKALNDYAKTKGFAMILDGVKLEQAGVLLGFDDKYDITKDFITFYNARPATASTASTGATTTPPVSKP
jgi:Skp family chaperone for outer membrane proteins